MNGEKCQNVTWREKFEENGQMDWRAMILKKKKKKKMYPTGAGLTPSRGNVHVYHNNIQRSSSLYEAAIGRKPVHYENTPMQKSDFFFTWKYRWKSYDISPIFAHNIGCGYMLEPPREPPRRGGSNEYPQSMFRTKNKKKKSYTPAYHSLLIKVGLKGVFIERTCFPDGIHE